MKRTLKLNPKFSHMIIEKKIETLTNAYMIASVLMTIIMLKMVVKFPEGRLLNRRALCGIEQVTTDIQK